MNTETPIECMDSELEVLYIMGTGRSGSTVLEVMLGNSAGVFGAGEIFALFEDGFVQNKACSCGRSFNTCEVWSHVKHECSIADEDVRVIAEVVRNTGRHRGFLRLAAGRLSKERTAMWTRYNRLLLQSIAKTTRATIVVDSSKFAGRALLLGRTMPASVRVIWLTRLPAGILASYRKQNKGEQPPHGTLWASAYILAVTFCAWIARLWLGRRCLHVSYEQLLAAPVETLEQIEMWSGYDLSKSKEMIASGKGFHIGHIVTGNRLRRSKVISLKAQPEPVRHAGTVARIASSVLGVWYRVLGI